MTYLDWASTAPPHEDILVEAARLAIVNYGNPSSRHGLGVEAARLLEDARAGMLAVLGREQGKSAARAGAPLLVFTSGGSEADAIVLLSILRRKASGIGAPPHIVTTAIEHSAVFEQARLLEKLGVAVSFVRPCSDGLVRPSSIASAMRKETALVAVMAVNNETGAIQPLAEIASAISAASTALGRREPPLFHADAVQALGKVPFIPGILGLSSAAFSAHKIGGPRGMGGLWLRGRLDPLALGGGQEAGIRAGTENLQGAWAFSRAAERACAGLDANMSRARGIEARLLAGLASLEGVLPLPLGRAAGDERYSPFILSAVFPGLSGEVLARALADRGVAVSTGAACSSRHAKQGRRVLEAMGLPEDLAFSAIRVSTGPATTEAEIDLFLEIVSELHRKLRT
jgi:cysteine desulfurase